MLAQCSWSDVSEGSELLEARCARSERFPDLARSAWPSSATGDFTICDNADCPDHCLFVRRSDDGCAHCQCEGNELVPSTYQCPAPKVDGPVRGDNKVCKPATREGKLVLLSSLGSRVL